MSINESQYQLISIKENEFPESVRDKLKEINFFTRCLTNPIPFELNQEDL